MTYVLVGFACFLLGGVVGTGIVFFLLSSVFVGSKSWGWW